MFRHAFLSRYSHPFWTFWFTQIFIRSTFVEPQVDMADALAPVEVHLNDGLVVEGKFFTQATEGEQFRLALKDVKVSYLS